MVQGALVDLKGPHEADAELRVLIDRTDCLPPLQVVEGRVFLGARLNQDLAKTPEHLLAYHFLKLFVLNVPLHPLEYTVNLFSCRLGCCRVRILDI